MNFVQTDIHSAAKYYLNGFRIMENIFMLDTKIETVERSLKERLFTFPWKPFKKTKQRCFAVPKEYVLKYGDKLICHPVFAKRIINSLNS